MSPRQPHLFATPRMQGALMPHVMRAVCDLETHSLVASARIGVCPRMVIAFLAAQRRHHQGRHCSYLRVRRSLERLARHELIECSHKDHGATVYRVTKRGWRWLDEWGDHYAKEIACECRRDDQDESGSDGGHADGAAA